jgi:hypothetical protein
VEGELVLLAFEILVPIPWALDGRKLSGMYLHPRLKLYWKMIGLRNS